MCNTCGCGISEPQKSQTNVQADSQNSAAKFSCSSCGAGYQNPTECCGQPVDRLCACGSGKKAKECCGPEPAEIKVS